MPEEKQIVTCQLPLDLIADIDSLANDRGIARQRYIAIVLRASTTSPDFIKMLDELTTRWLNDPPIELVEYYHSRLETLVKKKLVTKFRAIVKTAIENSSDDI